MSKNSKYAHQGERTCGKCQHKAVSTAGSQHRRCGGSPGAPPRALRNKLPKAERGVWN